MIENDVSCFPNNIVDILATRFQAIDPDLKVFMRPLRRSDPVQAVGVFGSLWSPDPSSMEMRGVPLGTAPGRQLPTIQTYLVTVEAYIKDQDEVRGLATHSILSFLVRSMLYGDQPLRVGLAALSVASGSSIERAQRWGIRQQRFSSNEIQGAFLYLSTLEFWLETETI
jgi:hypothetical protein